MQPMKSCTLTTKVVMETVVRKTKRVHQRKESAVKHLLSKTLWTMIEECLDDMIHRWFFNAQSNIRSVLCDVDQQEILSLLHKDDNKEILDAYIANIFNTNRIYLAW